MSYGNPHFSSNIGALVKPYIANNCMHLLRIKMKLLAINGTTDPVVISKVEFRKSL